VLPAVSSKKILFSGLALLVVALLYLYKTYNPLEVSFFPKCPFHSLTGLLCPGCGSQRALHHVLNGSLSAAFRENALLLIAIPYMGFGMYLDYRKPLPHKLARLRKTFFGLTAIKIILAIVISFWIIRNLI